MEPPPEPKAQDGQGDDDASQGSQDGQGDDDASQGSQDGQGDDDGSQGSQDGQGDDDDGPAGDAGEGEGAGSGPATDADLTKAIDAIAKRAGIDDLDKHNETATAYGLSVVPTKVSPPHNARFHPTMTAAAVAELNNRLPRNSLLHGQIGRLLVSAEVRRVTHHESSGRLDRRALARMRTGATDVFSRREDTPGIDTALMLLIDGSISMNYMVDQTNRRMDVAQTAAWHIARAAESANAKVCVASFHTIKDRRGDWIMGADVKVIKPWEIAMADRAAHLAAEQPNGGTPLSPAIMQAARMLADVSATRHILMVLTDGECDFGADGVTRACALATDMGVETVGIGMDCPSVTAAFPPRYSVNVENLHQLATTGLGVLVQMLEDANPRAGGND
jgi:Mg-chelatase subunit ChlD